MDINMPIWNGLESTIKILRFYDLIKAKRPIIIAQVLLYNIFFRLLMLMLKLKEAALKVE